MSYPVSIRFFPKESYSLFSCTHTHKKYNAVVMKKLLTEQNKAYYILKSKETNKMNRKNLQFDFSIHNFTIKHSSLIKQLQKNLPNVVVLLQ